MPLLCLSETQRVVSFASSYLIRPVKVRILESALNQERPDSKSCSNAYLSNFSYDPVIGVSPSCISKRDFLSVIFHELAHVVTVQQYVACPEGTGVLAEVLGRNLEGLFGHRPHSSSDDIYSEGGEMQVMAEAMATYLSLKWTERVSKAHQLHGRMRDDEGLYERARRRLKSKSFEHIAKNQVLAIAWLQREDSKRGGMARILKALCPGAYTLSSLKTNLDYYDAAISGTTGCRIRRRNFPF